MFPFLFFVCVFDLFFFVYFGREKGNKTLCREKKERAHFHFRFLQKKRKKNSVSSLKTSPRRWSSKEALLPAFFAVEAAAVECSLGCRTLHSQTPPSLAPTASAEAQRRLPPSPLDCCSLHAWDQATTVGVAAAILAAASAVEVSGGGDGAGAEAPPSPPPPPPPPAAVSASGRGRFAEEESAPLLLLLLSCCRCHSSSLAPGSSAEGAEARDLEAAAAAAEAEAFGTRLAADEAKGVRAEEELGLFFFAAAAAAVVVAAASGGAATEADAGRARFLALFPPPSPIPSPSAASAAAAAAERPAATAAATAAVIVAVPPPPPPPPPPPSFSSLPRHNSIDLFFRLFFFSFSLFKLPHRKHGHLRRQAPRQRRHARRPQRQKGPAGRAGALEGRRN